MTDSNGDALAKAARQRMEREAKNELYWVPQLYKDVLSVGRGPELVEQINDFCGMYETSVVRNSDGSVDAVAMAFNEGMRMVALHVREMLSFEQSEAEASEDVETEKED